MDGYSVPGRVHELTPSERKQEVGAKLQLEKENVEWLKERMVESEQLTSNMVEILTSFEQRLGRLEETILPVYQVTQLCKVTHGVPRTVCHLDFLIRKLGTYSGDRRTLTRRWWSWTMLLTTTTSARRWRMLSGRDQMVRRLTLSWRR